MLLSLGPAIAQQGPPGCAWKKYLYAQDGTQQGKVDINLLNQMSAMASAQGYSLTNMVWQVCNGWLMEAKRANGSPAILFVDPKTRRWSTSISANHEYLAAGWRALHSIHISEGE